MPEPTALITSLILDRPTCLDCLATKAGMGLAAVEAALDRIATALLLYRAPARCYTCGVTTAVVFVGRTGRV